MICMSRQSARSAAPDNAVTFLPSNQTSPEVGSISRRMQRPVVDLPQPDFADEAQGLAGSDLEAHPIDRVHALDLARQQPASDREFLDEIGDAQQRLGHRKQLTARSVAPAKAGGQGKRWKGGPEFALSSL